MNYIQQQKNQLSFVWNFADDGLASNVTNFLFPQASIPQFVSLNVFETLTGTDLTDVNFTMKIVDVVEGDEQTIFTATAEQINDLLTKNTQLAEKSFVGLNQSFIKLEIGVSPGAALTAGTIIFTVDYTVYPLILAASE